MVANIANVEKAVNLKVTRRLALNTQDVAKLFKAATIQTLATFKRWLKWDKNELLCIKKELATKKKSLATVLMVNQEPLISILLLKKIVKSLTIRH